MKSEHFQQVSEMKDERAEEVLFADSLFTAGRKHYKERQAPNIQQIPQDSLWSPQVVPLKT